MSDVNSGSALSRVLADYSLTRESAAETKKNNEMGRNEFLKLLVAQLENQDPTKPQDNGEFVAQLAQFSSLEESQKMSASFAGFASAFQSTQHLQATSLVGRPVHVASDTTALDATGGISIIADLEKSTSQASLSVYDQAGTLVDRPVAARSSCGQALMPMSNASRLACTPSASQRPMAKRPRPFRPS